MVALCKMPFKDTERGREAARPDVMSIQLKSATGNMLNYLRPNKACVSAGDNSSFR